MDKKTLLSYIIVAIAALGVWYLSSVTDAESEEQGATVVESEEREEIENLDQENEETEEVEEEKPTPPKLYTYLEVTEGCGPYHEGECLNVRSGPSTTTPSVAKLRTGMVLKVEDTVENEGQTWHKVTFDQWLRYPERVTSNWYVAADYVRTFQTTGPEELGNEEVHSNKKIVIDRSEQMLYAYEDEELFMEQSISTGLQLTPTPRGTFNVFRKTPTRYMQGPLPDISDDYYDLPGVPWNLYFTYQGAVIHGAYWHDKFGQPWSHGCVNAPVAEAEKLYHWADLGTTVIVQD